MTATQARTLNGGTKLTLTDETIRTGVSVSGLLSKNLHITKRTVIEGQLGLSEVVADVKIEDNARVTGQDEFTELSIPELRSHGIAERALH